MASRSLHDRICSVVRLIPPGQVTSYGHVAEIARCGARRVGQAMADLPAGTDVPWHRVLNGDGKISPRPGGGPLRQRRRLEAEGVRFDAAGRVDFEAAGWMGPDEPISRRRRSVGPPAGPSRPA